MLRIGKRIHFLVVILKICTLEITLGFVPYIPQEIFQYCPYSDICNVTATEKLLEADADEYVPCCESCACDSECGLRLDCCFKHLDRYRLVEKNIVKCTKPLVGNMDILDINEVANYYMVKSCNSEYNITANFSIWEKACPLEELGKIEPVSSIERNSIYLNKECAFCNNVYTFTVWNFVYHSGIKSYRGSMSWNIETSKWNVMGARVYIPPPNESWSAKLCANTISDICSETESEKENTLLNQKCKAIHAPYYSIDTKKTYKNFFCYQCAEETIKNRTKCRHQKTRTVPGESLTLLLDNTVFELSIWKDTAQRRDKSTVPDGICSHGYIRSYLKGQCVRVSCPDGMLNTPDGCKYFMKRMYAQVVYAQILLEPVGDLRLSEAILNTSLDATARSNPFSWIACACQKLDLMEMSVFYNSGTYINSILAQIRIPADDNEGLDPLIALPLIHNCASRNWKLKLNDKLYVFKPRFDTHLKSAIRRPVLHFWTKEHETSDFIEPILYKLIARGPSEYSFNDWTLGHTVVVKKTFFCRQVSIGIEEVEERENELVILGNNVSLGSNECTINSFPGSNATPTVSLCVDDYLRPGNEASTAGTLWQASLFIILVFGLQWLHI